MKSAAISKEYIELMDGALTFESTKDIGSTFTFTIPINIEELTEGKINIHPEAADLPILIVEDNKVNQLIMGKILEQLGYSYEVANHGEEAIDLLEDKPISVILMDLQMPVMDGFSCTKAIRNRTDALHDIPIIAVTANLMDTDVEHCIEAGMNEFIEKPVKVDQLESLLSLYICRSTTATRNLTAPVSFQQTQKKHGSTPQNVGAKNIY
ncbi:hypothetical protein LCGC14_1820480 [marine sediment metagenome]|uniref:Response regulatory domain-containing protein n=1 Tax=marine sediment metagenome TaxID=412755 RepID=A0A0F9IYW9_9ZZZZ|nr:hybrid sensor histidine kinase/response regulator [Porticoccus sp.]